MGASCARRLEAGEKWGNKTYGFPGAIHYLLRSLRKFEPQNTHSAHTVHVLRKEKLSIQELAFFLSRKRDRYFICVVYITKMFQLARNLIRTKKLKLNINLRLDQGEVGQLPKVEETFMDSKPKLR